MIMSNLEKKDCVFNQLGQCTALKCTYCATGDCNFYLSDSEYTLDENWFPVKKEEQ